MTFRMRDQLKQDLESSARAHGRTLSEEIGYRLDRSFVEGRALETVTQELKYQLREQGMSEEQAQEWVGTVSQQSPDAAAAPAVTRILPPATDLEETMYRAVLRALRDAQLSQA